MLDLAGVPVIICSIVQAFIEGVLSHGINLGISSIQVQLCTRNARRSGTASSSVWLSVSSSREFSEQWDAIAPQFVWVVRTTEDLQWPYTPMRSSQDEPRLPLDAADTYVVAKRSADDYVSDLVEYMSQFTSSFRTSTRRIREQERDRDIRKRDTARFKQATMSSSNAGLKPEPGILAVQQ